MHIPLCSHVQHDLHDRHDLIALHTQHVSRVFQFGTFRKQQRELIKFEVQWKMWARDDKFQLYFCSYRFGLSVVSFEAIFGMSSNAPGGVASHPKTSVKETSLLCSFRFTLETAWNYCFTNRSYDFVFCQKYDVGRNDVSETIIVVLALFHWHCNFDLFITDEILNIQLPHCLRQSSCP